MKIKGFNGKMVTTLLLAALTGFDATIEETVLDMLTTQDHNGRFATYSEEKELLSSK
mgnify:CR=1 FL=1